VTYSALLLEGYLPFEKISIEKFWKNLKNCPAPAKYFIDGQDLS
jgi:hypothetical protein